MISEGFAKPISPLSGGNIDSNPQNRDLSTAVDLHLYRLRLHQHVAGNGINDIFLERAHLVRVARRTALMGEKHLQALAGHGRGCRQRIATLEQAEKIHAALPPKMRPNRLKRSCGTLIARLSPMSLR